MWPFKSPANHELSNVELPPSNEVPSSTMIAPANNPLLPQQDATHIQPPSRPYHRLGWPLFRRLEVMAGLTAAAGLITGMKQGAEVASLRFRAENAHLTPTSKAGWYLYNRSKNYHATIGAFKQGTLTGLRYSAWTTLFITIERGLDAARGRLFASKRQQENGELRRGQADFLNTISAAVAVAGIHGWWNRMDRFASARMTRGAILFSLPFGLGQDLYAWGALGENTWYVDAVSRLLGVESSNDGTGTPDKGRKLV